MYIMNQNRVQDMCILLNSLQAIHIVFGTEEKNCCEVPRESYRNYIFLCAMNCARTNGRVELEDPTDVPEKLR